VVLLLAALVVTVAVGDVTDSVVIAFVVIANTVIGVVQEVRADRSIAALNRMAAPTARVCRDGVDAMLPAEQVARGDLVRLQAGDIVPADLRLVDSERLSVDESAVTGESLPVSRQTSDEISAGVVVVAGRGAGIAVRTGAASGLGRIAHLVATTRAGPTPLQRRLGRLSRTIGPRWSSSQPWSSSSVCYPGVPPWQWPSQP
jgi:Ca2+-transporting ATPase